MRIIDIEWEGPYDVRYDRNSDTYRLPEIARDLAENAHVYSIYGRHPVYGPNSLLYIGESTKSVTEAKVEARLKQHVSGRFWYMNDLFLYLGVASEDKVRIGEHEIIRNVESLLIASHIPAMNRQNIDEPNLGALEYHIFNWGSPGSLLPECSGRFFQE